MKAMRLFLNAHISAASPLKAKERPSQRLLLII